VERSWRPMTGFVLVTYRLHSGVSLDCAWPALP
jgi:hypothetical protein